MHRMISGKSGLPAVFILVLALISSFSPATGLSPFNTAEKSLLRSGIIMTFAYMKDSGEAESNVEDIPSFLNPVVSADNLQRYDVVIVEKAYLKIAPSTHTDLKIFNTLTNRSTLRGMKYYSITDGAATELILESYRVNSCNDRRATRDIIAGEVLSEDNSFFIIRDNRLGAICFNGIVVSQNGNFYETDISCGSVTRMGMKVFNSGGYVIRHYLVKDQAGGGYFYCSVQTMKLESSIMKRFNLLKPENFGNRIRGETIHFFKRLGYDLSSKLQVFR